MDANIVPVAGDSGATNSRYVGISGSKERRRCIRMLNMKGLWTLPCGVPSWKFLVVLHVPLKNTRDVRLLKYPLIQLSKCHLMPNFTN